MNNLIEKVRRRLIYLLLTVLFVWLMIGGQAFSDQEPQTANMLKLRVYYFHTRYRCATCRAIENLSQSIVEYEFIELIERGELTYEPINVAEREHKHFIDDYQLKTKTLILSRIIAGNEIGWKNLDKVWVLVGNPEKFQEYIVSEIKEIMKINKDSFTETSGVVIL